MVHVLLTSELPWQQNDSIMFFTFLCISQQHEIFSEIA